MPGPHWDFTQYLFLLRLWIFLSWRIPPTLRNLLNPGDVRESVAFSHMEHQISPKCCLERIFHFHYKIVFWVWGYVFNWMEFEESKFDSETNSVFLPGCSFICTTPRDLLSGPGVKTLHPQCRRPGFHCWSGNYVPHATALLQLIVHMPRLKSLYTTTESFLMLQLKNSQAARKIKDPACQS